MLTDTSTPGESSTFMDFVMKIPYVEWVGLGFLIAILILFLRLVLTMKKEKLADLLFAIIRWKSGIGEEKKGKQKEVGSSNKEFDESIFDTTNFEDVESFDELKRLLNDNKFEGKVYLDDKLRPEIKELAIPDAQEVHPEKFIYEALKAELKWSKNYCRLILEMESFPKNNPTERLPELLIGEGYVIGGQVRLNYQGWCTRNDKDYQWFGTFILPLQLNGGGPLDGYWLSHHTIDNARGAFGMGFLKLNRHRLVKQESVQN